MANASSRFLAPLLGLTVCAAVGCAPPSASGPVVQPGADSAPPVRAADVQAFQQAADTGTLFAALALGIGLLLQLAAFFLAVTKLRGLQNQTMDAEERLMHLDAIETYFDLPLYFGLLGTVSSFIVITLFPTPGVIFAYASTAFGIVVAVVLRLVYLTPYRQWLIKYLRKPSPDAVPPRMDRGR